MTVIYYLDSGVFFDLPPDVSPDSPAARQVAKKKLMEMLTSGSFDLMWEEEDDLDDPKGGPKVG